MVVNLGTVASQHAAQRLTSFAVGRGVYLQTCSEASSSNINKNSRFKQAQALLEKKILENALDKKWEYLIKVGEMNSWKK